MFYKGGKIDHNKSANTDLHGYGEAIRKELRLRVPRDKDLRVLDVGTGFGMNVAFLTSWLSRGSAIWTVDPSKEVLTEVKARLEGEEEGSSPSSSSSSSRVTFAAASVANLAFGDGFFDYVISVMVLHHVEDLQAALDEMVRMLKPGGALVVVDYKPKASHELEFTARHEEADFFGSAAVVKGIWKAGLVAKARDFGLWYLVEAKKKRREKKKKRREGTTGKRRSGGRRRRAAATRPLRAPRDGRARARSGR